MAEEGNNTTNSGKFPTSSLAPDVGTREPISASTQKTLEEEYSSMAAKGVLAGSSPVKDAINSNFGGQTPVGGKDTAAVPTTAAPASSTAEKIVDADAVSIQQNQEAITTGVKSQATAAEVGIKSVNKTVGLGEKPMVLEATATKVAVSDAEVVNQEEKPVITEVPAVNANAEVATKPIISTGAQQPKSQEELLEDLRKGREAMAARKSTPPSEAELKAGVRPQTRQDIADYNNKP